MKEFLSTIESATAWLDIREYFVWGWEPKVGLECEGRECDGILYLAPVPTAQITHPDCDLKTMSAFHSSLWENKHSDPRFFSLVFAKNSRIKKIFQEEKKFDNRTIFFFENSSVLGVFESRRQLHANHGTVRKSAISPQPGNQKLIKWSNTAYLNKRSFKILSVSSNKDFCMKVIRILMCNQ